MSDDVLVCWSLNSRKQPTVAIYHDEIPTSHEASIIAKMPVSRAVADGLTLAEIGRAFPVSHPGMKGTAGSKAA